MLGDKCVCVHTAPRIRAISDYVATLERERDESRISWAEAVAMYELEVKRVDPLISERATLEARATAAADAITRLQADLKEAVEALKPFDERSLYASRNHLNNIDMQEDELGVKLKHLNYAASIVAKQAFSASTAVNSEDIEANGTQS